MLKRFCLIKFFLLLPMMLFAGSSQDEGSYIANQTIKNTFKKDFERHGKTFSYLTVESVSFEGVKMAESLLRNTKITDSSFSQGFFKTLTFLFSNFESSYYRDFNITESHFFNDIWQDISIKSSTLEDVSFHNSTFKNVVFDKTTIKKVTFDN